MLSIPCAATFPRTRNLKKQMTYFVTVFASFKKLSMSNQYKTYYIIPLNILYQTYAQKNRTSLPCTDTFPRTRNFYKTSKFLPF